MTVDSPMSNEELLELAQHRIDELPPGEYQISEIYGEFYKTAILNPKAFGKTFKNAVKTGALQNIQLGRMDTGDKHWRYNLHGG